MKIRGLSELAMEESRTDVRGQKNCLFPTRDRRGPNDHQQNTDSLHLNCQTVELFHIIHSSIAQVRLYDAPADTGVSLNADPGRHAAAIESSDHLFHRR